MHGSKSCCKIYKLRDLRWVSLSLSSLSLRKIIPDLHRGSLMGQDIVFLRNTDAEVLRDLKLCWESSYTSLGCLARWVPAKAMPRLSVFPGGAITFLEERAGQLGLSCQKIEVSLGP